MNGSDSDDEDQLHILDTIPEEGECPLHDYQVDSRDLSGLNFLSVKKKVKRGKSVILLDIHRVSNC